MITAIGIIMEERRQEMSEVTVDLDTRSKEDGKAWAGFKGDGWRDHIDVRDFIQSNYTPYDGDGDRKSVV